MYYEKQAHEDTFIEKLLLLLEVSTWGSERGENKTIKSKNANNTSTSTGVLSLGTADVRGIRSEVVRLDWAA